MSLAAAKHYLVAAVLAIVAVAFAALAIYARSQKARAQQLTKARDDALRQAANARAGKALYKAASEAAESVRQKPTAPIDDAKRSDFEGRW